MMLVHICKRVGESRSGAMERWRTSSATELKRAALSAALKSSIVLKFLNTPRAGTDKADCLDGWSARSMGNDGHARWGILKSVCTEGEIAAEGDVLTGLAISDGTTDRVGGC